MLIPGGVLTVPALFLAGAASSLHCALMCGALSGAQARLQRGIGAGQATALVHAGRIGGYAALGALAGSLGAHLLQLLPAAGAARWLQGLAAVALIVIGVQQFVAAMQRRRRGTGCCAPPQAVALQRWMPQRLQLFVRGAAWALLPCGVLYSMVLLAAFSASAATGAMLMSAFAAGSAPLLIAAGVAAAWRPQHWRLSQLGAAMMVVLGAATLFAAADPAAAGLAAWCHVLR
jgi:sulfite exporter TauE/SafE